MTMQNIDTGNIFSNSHSLLVMDILGDQFGITTCTNGFLMQSRYKASRTTRGIHWSVPVGLSLTGQL